MNQQVPPLKLDHLAVVAQSLDEGVQYVEECLGVAIPIGGAHPIMGTHNHLLRLSNDSFLEVIAIDPDAAPPTRRRWFNLDNFRGDPKLGVWVLGTNDLDASLQNLPSSVGRKQRITRGNLAWHISVADDGTMPFDGAFPSLIQWPDGPHPASNMADKGCRLISVRIEHPEAAKINALLQGGFFDPKVTIAHGSSFEISAEIETPNGVRSIK